MDNKQQVDVVQADRDTAADFWQEHWSGTGQHQILARQGKLDNDPLIIAFARHRTTPPEAPHATGSIPASQFDAADFGSKVKAAVGTRSYRAAAKDAGVSSATINRVCRGRAPDVNTYLRLTAWMVETDAPPAVSEVERLREALEEIACRRPVTCDMTLAHEMADLADDALAARSALGESAR